MHVVHILTYIHTYILNFTSALQSPSSASVVEGIKSISPASAANNESLRTQKKGLEVSGADTQALRKAST